jgi:hypothetical protein
MSLFRLAARRPRCSPATRPGASPRTSPSCRSCCGGTTPRRPARAALAVPAGAPSFPRLPPVRPLLTQPFAPYKGPQQSCPKYGDVLKSPFPALAILQRRVVGRLPKTNQPAFGNRATLGTDSAARWPLRPAPAAVCRYLNLCLSRNTALVYGENVMSVTVTNGETYNVSSGQTDTGDSVNFGSQLNALSGGTISNAPSPC